MSSGYRAFAEMDRAELQAISRRGGVASGKARREKRRRIEERKTEELIKMGIIVEGISALKQIYRAMPPEDQLALYEYQRGG